MWILNFVIKRLGKLVFLKNVSVFMRICVFIDSSKMVMKNLKDYLNQNLLMIADN